MSTIKKFEDLEIWKLARELCQEVFQMTVMSSMHGLSDLSGFKNLTGLA